MNGTNKLLLGVSLVMVISLGVVLALLVVLLAELYCSLLLRKRQQASESTTVDSTNTASLESQQQVPSSDSAAFSGSVYSQGVLQAPRNLLFPAIAGKEKEKEEIHVQQRQHAKLEQFLHEIRVEESSPQPIQEEVAMESSKSGGSGEHLVYISNPIYDNQACQASSTPFETPDTSPSRLGMSASSSSSPSTPSSLPMTPPLIPMKKLPEQACSVSLRDARSLGASGSGSDSVNGPSSSSSSGSPRTSPSW